MGWTAQGVPVGWTVDSGYRSYEEAAEAAKPIQRQYEPYLALMTVTYTDGTTGERWCILVREVA